MISFDESHNVQGPFPGDGPLETVVEFYRTNGYTCDDRSDDGGGRRALLERTSTDGGVWSSNTAQLATRVEVTWDGDELTIRYLVDQAGQPITESDRNFWRREMRAAANSARNPSRRPIDIRHEAAKNAEHFRRRLLSRAIWILIGLMSCIVCIDFFTTGGSF